MSSASTATTTHRSGFYPEDFSSAIGFRCALNLERGASHKTLISSPAYVAGESDDHFFWSLWGDNPGEDEEINMDSELDLMEGAGEVRSETAQRRRAWRILKKDDKPDTP